MVAIQAANEGDLKTFALSSGRRFCATAFVKFFKLQHKCGHRFPAYWEDKDKLLIVRLDKPEGMIKSFKRMEK
jgi:hypothetical protein